MIFDKGVCTFKKLSTLIVQTTFPTLQKDPMDKKQNLLPRDEKHQKKKLRVRSILTGHTKGMKIEYEPLTNK